VSTSKYIALLHPHLECKIMIW